MDQIEKIAKAGLLILKKTKGGYEKLIENKLKTMRSAGFWEHQLKLLEALWDLEKKFARKEDRKMNFGLNVVFVDKTDAPNFKRLRDYVGLPPLSPKHKRAIEDVRSKLEQKDQDGNQL